MSWLIIERYLSLMWEREVINKVKGNKRKKKLNDSARWSADYIIEILNLLNKVSDENYKKLTMLRKKRNNIIHKGEDCSISETKECLNLARLILIGGLEPDGIKN